MNWLLRAAAAAAVSLVACAGSRNAVLRAESVGRVGCPPNEIQIRDVRNGVISTWTAVCRGRAWYCADNPTTCTPADKSQVAQAAPKGPDETDGLSTEFDEFERRTTVTARFVSATTATTFAGHPELAGSRVHVTVHRKAGAPAAYRECRNLDLSIDGKVMSAAPADVTFNEGGGPISESLSVAMPLPTIDAMAKPDATTTLRACQDIVRFSAKQRLLLRSFLLKWRSLAAKAPHPPAAADVQVSPAVTTSAENGTAPTVAEPTAAVGCQYDTQCKGERVCVAGQCVDPSPAPSTGSPPPASKQ